MCTAADASDGSGRYDGWSGDDLARHLGVPGVRVYDEIGSTLDAAHLMAAAGAPAGTIILANAQTAGRGRFGRVWHSERGAGIWLTVLERPRDVTTLELLSLRVGIALAPALERFATGPVGLKWPNDLCVGRRKLAGILVEARWRDASPEWVAIGVGINVRRPGHEPRAVGLRAGASRIAVLEEAVQVIRSAAARAGPLDDGEIQTFSARDVAAGRACVEPVTGVVQGIDRSGALVVAVTSGQESRTIALRAGSLTLKEER